MWMMMQHDVADDWVLATGKAYSVEQLVKIAFETVGLNFEEHLLLDKKYERPNEVNHLLGDPSKAREQLGWVPEVTFEELVKMMVESDLVSAQKKKY